MCVFKVPSSINYNYSAVPLPKAGKTFLSPLTRRSQTGGVLNLNMYKIAVGNIIIVIFIP